MMLSKPILIITYYWPPSGGSGVQRWVYFSKYLKKLGYSPIVLTIDLKSASYPAIDRSLINETQGIPVHYVKSFNWIKIYSWFKKGKKDKIPQGEFSKKGLVDHIAAFIRGNFFIPDARVNWAKSAIKEALRIVKSHKIEKIITTGPPHSTHLIGLNLKKQLNFKWIADFRDPWTDIFYVKSFYRLSFAKKKDKLFERKVLSNANAIITTTSENFQKELQSKISINQNFFKIYNGYDSDLFKKIKKRKNKDFQIVFTGLLTENHPYKEFIESFIKFLKKDPKVNVKIILAGSISEKILNEFNRISNIEFHGYINHQDAVNLMIDGNILLNFMYKQEKNTTMISGKLIEYMATGNPVLMIGDKKSEASKLLSKQTYNLTADPKETKIISNFIKSNYINWIEKKEIKNEVDVIKDYTREETTRSLIEIIEKI
ncbi:MAG: hypothetical protein CMC41_06735 [Flavobacteriaceae bacterium]|nr:hypothetical protein [Flavobacteriaceae bacterium]